MGRIVILVDGEVGEETIKMSEITYEQFVKIQPLTLEIKKYAGYYPTGDYYDPEEPGPEELYGSFPGFDMFERFLPSPDSGFGKILEINVFQEDPITLYM